MSTPRRARTLARYVVVVRRPWLLTAAWPPLCEIGFFFASRLLHRPDGLTVQAGDRLELVDALLQTLGGEAPAHERVGGHYVQWITGSAKG
jgi:hypothetical protein